MMLQQKYELKLKDLKLKNEKDRFKKVKNF